MGFAINNSGQVVGSSTTSTGVGYAFLYSNGTMQNLGSLAGLGSGATAINDAGEVTGGSTISVPTPPAHNGGVSHAFLYSNGAMQDLGTVPPNTSSIGYGIDANGDVVGTTSSSTPAPPPTAAFLYSNGTMQALSGFPAASVEGLGINASGEITGLYGHAFIYSNGTVQDLGTLGGMSSAGYAINATGEVTGASGVPGDNTSDAFLYSNGTMTDLGSLGGVTTYGYAINAGGEVVGVSDTAAGPAHAFVYSNGAMKDLNSLISNSDLALYTLTDARGINDSGQIVANGIVNAIVQTVTENALLLTPTCH